MPSTETITLSETSYAISYKRGIIVFDLVEGFAYERRQKDGPYYPLWVQTANYTPASPASSHYDEYLEEDIECPAEPASGVLTFKRLLWDKNGLPVLPKGEVRMSRGEFNLEDDKISFSEVSWINCSSDEKNWETTEFSQITPPKSIEVIQVPAGHQITEEQKLAVYRHSSVGVIEVFMHLPFSGPAKIRGVLTDTDGRVFDLVHTSTHNYWEVPTCTGVGQFDRETCEWTTARGLEMVGKHPIRRPNSNWIKVMNSEPVM